MGVTTGVTDALHDIQELKNVKKKEEEGIPPVFLPQVQFRSMAMAEEFRADSSKNAVLPPFLPCGFTTAVV
jgi:hypothetical protein